MVRSESPAGAPNGDAADRFDTAIFFSVAFAGTAVPWVTLAIGDLGVKLGVALAMLLPFRLAMAATADFMASADAENAFE